MATKIYGHRGSAGEYPENSMLGFRKAIEVGVDGIEIDIHLTKDNEVVIFHDSKLDRTSTGTGYLKDYTLEELRQFRLGPKFRHFEKYEERWDEETIPTLIEALELFKQHDVELNIELKTYDMLYPGMEEKMFKLVEESGIDPDKVNYSSFHIPTMMILKEINPSAKLGFCTEFDFYRQYDYYEAFGLDTLNPDKKQVFENPDLWEPIASKISVWTVNETDQIQKLIDMGVGSIITDYPARAVELLRKSQGKMESKETPCIPEILSEGLAAKNPPPKR